MSVTATVDGSETVSVMSFNIRIQAFFITIADFLSGFNCWRSRKGRVLNVIREASCDVVGLQECALAQWSYLEGALQQRYESYAVDSGGGETCAIFWKRERFERVTTGTFWLNPGFEEGKKMQGANRARICSWARLKDRASGQDLTVYNTHFDNATGETGERVKGESAALVLDKMAEAGMIRSILMGDLNSRPGWKAGAVLSAALLDSYAVMKPGVPDEKREGTSHGWEADGGDQFHIDYIYCTRDAAVTSYEVSQDHGGPGSRWPSDHFPITAMLKF